MLTDSSAFATIGYARGEHPVMVPIDGSTVHDTPFNCRNTCHWKIGVGCLICQIRMFEPELELI